MVSQVHVYLLRIYSTDIASYIWVAFKRRPRTDHLSYEKSVVKYNIVKTQ